MKKIFILLFMFIVFAAYGEGITCKAYEELPTSYQIFWLSGYYRALDYAVEETQDVLILNMLLVPGITDRKSVVQGKSVDLGGRRIIKKKK